MTGELIDLTARQSRVSDPDNPAPKTTADLLEAIGEQITRFVVVPSAEARTALQLFVMHTWSVDAAGTTPYLALVSAEKRSGKTKLLEVLELLVREPWLTAGASESALFRTIEADCPTLLLDEVDAIFASNTDRTEPLRALLNAGNKRRTTISRCVPPKFEPRKFSTFCPKILSGIDTGKLPETVTDRSIVIHMKRRHAGEHVERLREKVVWPATEPLRTALRGWAENTTEILGGADPHLPDALSDRSADAWEPLFAIADHAGPDWGEKARAAAIVLSGASDDGELGRGAQLLTGIRAAIGDEQAMSSADLLEKINADEELPFGGWRDGRGLDGRSLSRLLKPYGIGRPTTIRFGEKTAKGYRREMFLDAWKRYLPAEAVTTVTSVTGESPVTEKASKHGAVTAVTGVTGPADVTDERVERAEQLAAEYEDEIGGRS